MNPLVYPLVLTQLPSGLKGIAVLVCPKKYNILDLLAYYDDVSLGMKLLLQTAFEKMSKTTLPPVIGDGEEKQPSKKDQKKNKLRLKYPTKKKRATRICILEARLKNRTRNYTSEINLLREIDA